MPGPTGHSTPFSEQCSNHLWCMSVCVSPARGQCRQGTKMTQSQTPWHFIVYKTMAPGGRNTIVMLTAANTEGKRLAGRPRLMLQEGLHLVTSRVLQASSSHLCILKSHSPNVTTIYQGGGQAPSQTESDETVQGVASSREMSHSIARFPFSHHLFHNRRN